MKSKSALRLPESYRSYPPPQVDFRHLPAGEVLLEGVPGESRVSFRPVPKLQGRIQDLAGRSLGFTAFGDTRPLQQYLRQHPQKAWLSGRIQLHGGRAWLTVNRGVEPGELHTTDAIYIGGMSSTDARPGDVERVLQEAFPDRQHLSSLLAAQGWRGDVASLARSVLTPPDRKTGEEALGILDVLSACAVIEHARQDKHPSPRPALDVQYPIKRIQQLPKPLTEDQHQALKALCTALSRPACIKTALIGDVGYGKTLVYLLAAAAVVEAGGRVAILVPSQVLVHQVSDVLQELCPDLFVRAVTAGLPVTKSGLTIQVGTTRLLNGRAGELDLAIIDEQQRFGAGQRLEFGKHSHQLEVTATLLPRSQALVEFAGCEVVYLRNGPVQRQVDTRIWEYEQRMELFRTVKETVKNGGQILAVYPRKKHDQGRRAAKTAAEVWNSHFPGRVRLLVGGQNIGEAAQTLWTMRSGNADILVATTVGEVGIDLPRLQRVVVAEAERFGLCGLHQLRGRVARQGGQGFCDLVISPDAATEARERLKVLVHTQDGFAVAEQDLKLRSGGELEHDGTRQSGSTLGLWQGRNVRLSTLDYAARLLDSIG